ncbi:MAG TPA: pitrilysin family protein [Myxococcaceae bacterium]|nr:pitrilysin family protein [Myxococcaceae bacterium]
MTRADRILPPRSTFTTADGLEVVVAHRGRIPLVSLRLVLAVGSAADPPDRPGLADFTVRLLRRGTARLDADALNEAVEFVGATLAVFAAEDFLALAVTAPAEHLGTLLDVLGQMVREPTFPEDEFETERRRVLAQFANDLDDPGLLADRALQRAVWGAHPYGHDVAGNRVAMERLVRADVVGFHRLYFGPGISRLVLVGAVDARSARPLVERAFAGWRGGASQRPLPPPLEAAVGEGQVVVVDRPEQTQAQVRLGGLGYRRGAPEAFAAQVMNAALGGGFTSRLVRAVRIQRGLSYGVGSSFEPMRVGGSFLVSSFTKVETTGALLEVLLAEVARMRGRGPTRAELGKAQEYLAGLFPLRVETNEAVASAIADIWLFGLGEDWVDLYRSRIRGVTRADAARAAASFCFPRPPAVALVGPAEPLRRVAEALGPVTVRAAAEMS